MRYLILIADIDEFNPCKESLGDIVKKEYKIKHMPAFDFSYNNHECTAVCFGIGKVNAALGAALALNYDEFDGVIMWTWCESDVPLIPEKFEFFKKYTPNTRRMFDT